MYTISLEARRPGLPERNDSMDKVLQILRQVRGDVDFENETELIDDGILSSFDIVAIISELTDAFDISISPEDMTPENFNSAGAIYKMVKRLQDEG